MGQHVSPPAAMAGSTFFITNQHRRAGLQPTAMALAARTLLCWGLITASGTGAALLATPAQAQAQAASYQFQIPAGSLDQALNRFAATAGIELSVDAALTAGKSSAGLNGRYTIEAGFSVLLKDQGLVTVRGSNGAYSLRRSAAAHDDNASALPNVNVTATAQSDVVTEQTGSYTTRALTIGKATRSMRETPQSVSVVTRQQMDDQNLAVLDQVLAQSTGFTRTQRNFGSHTFMVRGFAMDNYLIDGVSGTTYSPTGWFPMDMAIYDRVEIIRGAASMIVGAADPSGAVNLVRKRPRAESHFSVTGSVGSWNNYRTEVDGGGTINEAGTLRGRVVAAYQDRRYFYDGASTSEPMLYGILEADLGRDTTLAVGVRHQENTTSGFWLFGLPRYSNGNALDVSRSTSLAQRWNQQTSRVDEVFADLEHRLGDDWKFKLSANHAEGKLVQKLALPRGAVNSATLSGSRFYQLYFKDLNVTSDGLDANVTGSFKALGGTHDVMFGTSVLRQREYNKTASVTSRTAIDVFNVNHDAIAEPVTPAYSSVQDARTEQYGVYGSTRLQLAQPLHLLLGGRLSWLRYKNSDVLTGDKLSDYKQDSEFTPYTGLIYDLNPQWSVYASYADTFQPQSAYMTASGAPLKPAVGSNYEAGIKGELYDGRLNVSAAVFRVRKTGVAVVDQANLGNCPSSLASTDCYLNSSLLRSEGFETEISGELTPGWQVAAGYTFVISHGINGQSISAETPHHLLRASTSYRMQGALSGWTIGGGVSAQTGYSFLAEDDDSVRMGEGGRAVWDLNASYRINRHWTASVNLANVFDKRYYTMVGTLARGNYYGDPRNVMLTLRGDF
jgi:outer membrane receptor for ferric coprogen and ferric-rhodotorulic acid